MPFLTVFHHASESGACVMKSKWATGSAQALVQSPRLNTTALRPSIFPIACFMAVSVFMVYLPMWRHRPFMRYLNRASPQSIRWQPDENLVVLDLHGMNGEIDADGRTFRRAC